MVGPSPTHGPETNIPYRGPSPPPSVEWQSAQNPKRWVIPLVGGFVLLMFLPAVFVGISQGMTGPWFLIPAVPLAAAFVLMGMIGAHTPDQRATPGRPAPFGATPYGITRTPGEGIMARVHKLPAPARGLHETAIWASIGTIVVGGLGVMAAIVFGPRGVEAVGAGLGVVLGAIFLIGAYVLASYRALLPTAIGAAIWGILIEVQSIIQAWTGTAQFNHWWLLLLVPMVAVQSLATEGAFRGRKFWGLWSGVGILAASAYPVWRYIGVEAGVDIALGLSLASLVWGVTACYGFLPIPPAMRWSGVSVFALWSAILALSYALNYPIMARLQAAAFVAAVVAAAITVAVYYLVRPCAPHVAPRAARQQA